MKKKKVLTNNKGITLIALIITVIVMLILAGVAINMVIGDNGIFKKTDEGAKIYKNVANNEATSLNGIDKEMEDLMKDLEDNSNPNKIVDVIGVGERIYALTATGEVRLANVLPGNIFGTLEIQDEVLTKNGIRQKGSNYFIDNAGKVYTWGYNYYGQVGDGTTKSSSLPICISDIENSELKGKNIVKIVEADEGVVIALDDKGKVYAWGQNNYGQLGDGTTKNSSMPICISDIENSELKDKKIIEIVAEESLTIAIDDAEKVYTWGQNNYGQLGDGTTKNSSMPICISDIENSELKDKKIYKIVAQNFAVIAIDDEQNVYDWGYGKHEKPTCISGDGSVLKGKNIVDIKGALALDSEGKIYYLGDKDNLPICISDIAETGLQGKKLVEIFDSKIILGVDNQGNIYEYGTSENSVICMNEMQGSAFQGKSIVEVENVTYKYNEKEHILVQDNEGKIYAWGNNWNGELGDGTTETRGEPICISNIENSELYQKEIKKIEHGSSRFDNANYYYIIYIGNEGAYIRIIREEIAH